MTAAPQGLLPLPLSTQVFLDCEGRAVAHAQVPAAKPGVTWMLVGLSEHAVAYRSTKYLCNRHCLYSAPSSGSKYYESKSLRTTQQADSSRSHDVPWGGIRTRWGGARSRRLPKYSIYRVQYRSVCMVQEGSPRRLRVTHMVSKTLRGWCSP